jgi:hypothetical protein
MAEVRSKAKIEFLAFRLKIKKVVVEIASAFLLVLENTLKIKF